MIENEDKLIPGIYNYCDRWCEKCSYTDRCRVFLTDADRRIEHILNDEDPDSMETAMQDVSETLHETLEMLKEKMKEEGIDEIPEEVFEYKEPDFDYYAAHNIANEYFDLGHKFLEAYGKFLHENYKDPEEIASIADEAFLNKMMKIKDSFETISWYSPQILVKVKSAISQKEIAENEEDEESKEFDNELAIIAARIAYVGIEKSYNALQLLYDFEKDFEELLEKLLVLLKNLKDELVKEFSEVTTFKRPYFD